MNIIHILAVLAALVTIVPGVIYLLPVKFDHRFLPLTLAACALVTYNLPTSIDVPLALCWPAMWLLNLHGIDLQREAVDYGPAAGRAKQLSKRAAATVRDWLPRRRREPEQPVEMTEFIKHGYPDPDTVTADDAGGVVDDRAAVDAGDDDAGELEAPEQQTRVPKWVPEL